MTVKNLAKASPDSKELDNLDLWKEVYSQCYQDKRHYDLLSWSIGAALLAYATIAMQILVKIENLENSLRILIALSSLPFFIVWIWIYERNRVWGEIANEVARDIERRFGIDGLQLRYMRSSLSGLSMRTNSDLPRSSRKMPQNLISGEARAIRLRVPSMHYALYILSFFVIATPLVFAVITYDSSMIKIENTKGSKGG
jgi:hypothetical protein